MSQNQNEHRLARMWSTMGAVVMMVTGMAGAAAGLAADASGVGEIDPAARFQGAPTYDFAVTNVKWEAATPEYSYVTFDLYWSYSWRQKWTEPAKTSATGKDMEVENWDAAWVFVKFLPETNSLERIDRNHWQHASLASDSSQHVMPAGATNAVKLSDDGTRGMGVFIYRDAVGHGVNDWKNIKLRWLHANASVAEGGAAEGGTDKFDPTRAAIKVHAIPMVYVPAGPFKVGSGAPSGIIEKFADGPDVPIVCTMASIRPSTEFGGLTDGSWRGGPSIPFLLDTAWNGPAAEGTHARRFGIVAGELWGTHTFWEVNLGSVTVGGAGVLNDGYPTGYDAFYCMKYELTQGQYVDFLNSLPPDVAAKRAFVGSEVYSDAGLHSATVKIDMGPDQELFSVVENGGCTIFSSADVPELKKLSAIDVMPSEKKMNDIVDDLMEQIFSDIKAAAVRQKRGPRPVFTARLPFRRIPGTTPSDTFAYAVWSGLRPMSGLEGGKAGSGARDPIAPPDPDWTSPKDLEASPVLLDEGLPTERYLKGNARFGCSFAPRVGCRSTPTSDRGTALATYWGISELGGPSIPVSTRGFRGTHGNGMTSPGKPAASFKRTIAKFKDAPADWPEWWSYLGGHFVETRCRLVASADNRIRKPAGEEPARATKPKPAAPLPPIDGRQDDLPRIANVKVEPGKEYSTVSFDLAWNNSWRAKWTEPAEKNCTGTPLPIESWDAAWVFLKFRRPETPVFSHATLSPDAAHHVKPAGAALDLGLSDNPSTGLGAGRANGIGVFIYRDAVGQGANAFKGVKLRWLNGSDHVDPATAEISVHALAMVYVPEGPFRSKSPFVYPIGGSWTPQAYACQLTTIDTPNATKLSGHVNFSTNYVREGPEWPNGYSAFYCMKYSISQGEYARFLTEAAPDPKTATYNGEYGYGPHNAFRRYAPGLYGLCGYTIRYSAGEVRYEADVPERPANFLSDADIHSFTAWAGLRPPTCLEYEKACRGPRAVARDEDAWAPGACAPAVGLAGVVPSLGRPPAATPSRLSWPGPSYWGIRDLSQSGSVLEWPAVVKEDGRGYIGTHGTGAPEPRWGDWVFTSGGEWYRLGMWQGYPLSEKGVWLLPEDFMRMPGDIGNYISTRSGRYGARAVRTAAGITDKDSPLQVDALPNLAGFDMAIAYLSGRFKNDGDKPLKVELVSALPDDCFPQGAASRAFTAAAKATTSFKVPVVLTRAVTNATVLQGRLLSLPLRIQGPGGEALAEFSVRLPPDVLFRPSTIIPSLDGGTIELKVTNVTENPLTLAFVMEPPPTVRLDATDRSITLAAGGAGGVSFPVLRQWFPQEVPCRIPYRVTIGSGAALAFEAVVELRTQTRWWIKKRIKSKPKMGVDYDELGGLVYGLSDAGDVFTLAAPSKGWKSVTCGSTVTLGEAGPLLLLNSKAIGATRAIVAVDADAAVDVRAINAAGFEMSLNPTDEGEVAFFLNVWVNDKPAFDSRLPANARAKPVHLHKGVNTVVVEWRSNTGIEPTAENVRVQFNDATSGEPLPDVFFDMDAHQRSSGSALKLTN